MNNHHVLQRSDETKSKQQLSALVLCFHITLFGKHFYTASFKRSFIILLLSIVMLTGSFLFTAYPAAALDNAQHTETSQKQMKDFLVTSEEPDALKIILPPYPPQTPISPPPSLKTVKPMPFTGWPELTADGFLQIDKNRTNTEFIYSDEKKGTWIYLSDTLRIEINRISARVERRDVIWFLADIRFKLPEAFQAFSANPKSPAKGHAKPEAIAKQHSVVYAQNGDLFTFRVSNKEKAGIIIRNGQILQQNTYTRAHAVIPPLDELSLYPDGHIEMYTPGELNPQEYLSKGATDVLSFGPILFKNYIKDNRLDKSFTSLEPRSAIGVIGPGHFVGIMVEGRNKRSGGAPLRFVADRLLEAGCYEAFTLDGGQTAAMIFMGQNVMDPGIYHGFHKTRNQPDIIGIGLSESVWKK